MNDLSGQVAVITGAGRGIGKGIALAYAEAGAAVICAARTFHEVEQTANEIKNAGGKASAFVVDVTDFETAVSLFQHAHNNFGGVDIVLINAGVSHSQQSVEESDPKIWAEVIQINLMGAYHTAKAAIPHLKERGGGKILLMGSGLGHKGIPNRSAYSSSKAGLWMLTRVLAQELAPYSISVNEIIPGPVRTEMTPGTDGEIRGTLGLGEWVKAPKDVAPLALFLATQPNGGPTAQSFSLMRRDG
ncbi:MAG: SDR family oxidoreductase [Chloroflexota bacterium]